MTSPERPRLTGLYDSTDQTTNDRGQWVPAIPFPLFVWPHRHRCECGRWFWTMGGYRGHYALTHILATP
jgi:hypothetical protein